MTAIVTISVTARISRRNSSAAAMRCTEYRRNAEKIPMTSTGAINSNIHTSMWVRMTRSCASIANANAATTDATSVHAIDSWTQR